MHHYFNKAISFFLHRLTATGRYRIHPPFLYDFYVNVLRKNPGKHPVWDAIEDRLTALQRNTSMITIHDHGAGIGTGNRKSIAAIAKRSTTKKKYRKLFYKIIRHYDYKNILELGTSFGFSTLYMATADKDAKIITVEGDPASATIAQENFKLIQPNNITLYNQLFDEALNNILSQATVFDFIYIDGNHQKEPTIRYFEQILSVVGDKSLVVFDDIRWSTGMQEAWETIAGNPRVTLAVDLWQTGIVFFNPGLSKSYVKIRY